ncbi:MAG: hypothetical protein WBC71_12870, partial [Salaquimonas sp.]
SSTIYPDRLLSIVLSVLIVALSGTVTEKHRKKMTICWSYYGKNIPNFASNQILSEIGNQ